LALTLSAEQKNILKVFKIEEQYIIPAYQRPYSWTYDLCSVLYDDILNAFKDKEDYFIGNIIISSDDTNKDKLMVIDGQQRLTTVLLFIKVLSIFEPLKPLNDILKKEDWKTGKSEDRIVSKVFETEDRVELNKVLNMTKEDFEIRYSECLILRGKNKGKFSEKNCENIFEKNILYFYDWIKFYAEHNDNLQALIFFLLESIYLLPIELNGKDEQEAKEKAIKIFETMNNRGLSLNDTDIFKAYLYDKADRINEAEIFKSSWADLKNRCELINVEVIDIFRYYSHIIRAKNNQTTSEINLRNFFTREDNSPFKLENYKIILDELFQIITIVEYIYREKNKNTELSKWIQLINIYTNQYPKIALIVYLFHNINVINIDNILIDFLRKLVRFAYYQGSTTRIKYEIYNIIKKVSHNLEIDDYIEDEATINEFVKLGGLKNGYALLAQYLKEEKAFINTSIDRIIKQKDKNKLNSSWDNIEIKSIENRLGNIIVYDSSNMQNDISSFTYQTFEQQDLEKRNILVEFFQGKR
jgi:uncharacterized protein with ParB-like and HNH nuclease domain